MKIYFASDHAGFEMKKTLVGFVKELGFDVEDLGPYELNPEDDYPEFVEKAAQKVSEDSENARAVILGGSGQGEAIVANRFPNVRAVVFYGGSREVIKLSREHNDANILSLGAKFLKLEDAQEAVKLWLETKFSGEERHKRRIKEIEL